MFLLKVLWANIAHATHSFKQRLIGHRMIIHSIKPAGACFYRPAQIECECGKSFYSDSKLKHFLH